MCRLGRHIMDEREPKTRQGITLEGRMLASVSKEKARVNVLRTTSAEGLPALDVLAGLAAADPTGIVFIGDGTAALAFALEQGRIVAAHGNGPRGSMSAFCSGMTREDRRVWATDHLRIEDRMHRAFIERCVLDRLALGQTVGAQLTLLRGDVHWLGPKLAREHAPRLPFVIMEHARETDERTRLEGQRDGTQWIARQRTASAPSRRHLRAVPDEERGFGELIDEPGATPALLAAVSRRCDGQRTIAEIVEASPFGRAPTLRALADLERGNAVELVPVEQRKVV